jgi:hypothetical protein
MGVGDSFTTWMCLVDHLSGESGAGSSLCAIVHGMIVSDSTEPATAAVLGGAGIFSGMFGEVTITLTGAVTVTIQS